MLNDMFKTFVYRVKNIRNFWDFFWVGVVSLNLFSLLSALYSNNLLQAAISALFLFACFR